MALDEIDLAWVRFVAIRDQLMAARKEENAKRETAPRLASTGRTPRDVDLRAVANPRRTRLTDGDRN